jgi:NAD(P)H dehydrogenase (quinone)
MSKKVLVVYDSNHGVVEQMATIVASGVRDAGVEAVVEKCDAAEAADMEKYDGIIIGSPCFFAAPSAAVKTFIDSSWSIKGKLEGKVGAAFTSSEHISGGNELTLRSIIDSFLIHGMIVQGDPESDHFGSVVIKPQDGEAVVDTSGESYRLGKRVAGLVKKLG